ncbi:MAG: efflux RND transporter periplasmic adaptor subunit, partial [Polyangiaceae bacterium]
MSALPESRRSLVGSIAFALALVALAALFHRPLVAWFTGKSTGGREGAAVTAHAGPFTLSAALDPDPPATSGDALVLRVTDAAGNPVDDASVEVIWDMPAMGAMAEMKGSAKVSHEAGGRCRAEFDVPMGGSWTLMTTISSPAGRAKQDFTMTVGGHGLTSAGAAAVPAGTGDAQAPVVRLDEARRQLIGVRTGSVVEGPMRESFRAVGRITYDESKLADVNLKVRGWITRLFVDQTGQRVRRGQPLFTLYSPELYTAEQDFLLATRSAAGSAAPDGGATRGAYLATAARQRLHLLGVDDAQIDALARSGTPSESVTIGAPASGFVIEKSVVEGAGVDAGMRLFRIAALDRVWVEAEVYEADLAHVKVGQRADVTLDYLPGRSYEAKVAYVYPYLDPATRTGRVRIELANGGLD